MKKLTLLTIALVFYQFLYSQHTFTNIYSNAYQSEYIRQIQKLEDNTFLLLTLQYNSDSSSSAIYHLDQEGKLLNSVKLPSIALHKIFIKENSYFSYGFKPKSTKSYFCKFDSQFNVVNENYYTLPDFDNEDGINANVPFVEINDTLFVFYTRMGAVSNCYLLKTYQCDSIEFKSTGLYDVSDAYKGEGNNVYLIANGIQIYLYDYSMNLINYKEIIVNGSYIHFPSVLIAENDQMYVAGCYFGYEYLPDLIVAKLDENLNISSHYVIENPDVGETFASFKSISSWNNYIFVFGTSGDVPINSGIKNQLIIAKFDDNLNLIWEKYLGNDATYWAKEVIACEDGGVLVAALYFNPAISNNIATYVIKLNANGELNNTTSNEISFISDVVVYPNPGYSELSVRKAAQHKQLKFCLYNAAGVLVLEETLQNNVTSFNTESLPAGTYFYKITGENNFQESGKWIKL